MNNNTVKLGVIGLGPRAETLLATLRDFSQEECCVTAICDINPERINFTCELFKKHKVLSKNTYLAAKSLQICDL